MIIFLCNSLSPALSNPPLMSSRYRTQFSCNESEKRFRSCPSFVSNTLIRALSGFLSFNLLFSSLPSIALDSPSVQTSPPSSSSSLLGEFSEYCDEADEYEKVEGESESVPDESIVEEAWEIVNDSFLSTGRHSWSPETWQLKKEDILSTSIQSPSKAHSIIKRLLASLGDPYTRFLSPPEFSKMARYDMTGIGINVREVPNEIGVLKLKVLGLILDSPAQSAGVKQGDEILAVNEEDVRGKSAFEVSSLLQGPNETFVTITVKHGNCGPIQSVQVQRQVIARTPVFYRLEQIDNGASNVGYIRLKEFNALARKDLLTEITHFAAMKRLQDMGASYFILDLRDNLGGLVQAGIEISKLFLSKGDTVIYTVGRDPQYQNTILADSPPLVTAPVVVLVNRKTASASEIVASALHDNCRAVLVGERTFGKHGPMFPIIFHSALHFVEDKKTVIFSISGFRPFDPYKIGCNATCDRVFEMNSLCVVPIKVGDPSYEKYGASGKNPAPWDQSSRK